MHWTVDKLAYARGPISESAWSQSLVPSQSRTKTDCPELVWGSRIVIRISWNGETEEGKRGWWALFNYLISVLQNFNIAASHTHSDRANLTKDSFCETARGKSEKERGEQLSRKFGVYRFTHCTYTVMTSTCDFWVVSRSPSDWLWILFFKIEATSWLRSYCRTWPCHSKLTATFWISIQVREHMYVLSNIRTSYISTYI